MSSEQRPEHRWFGLLWTLSFYEVILWAAWRGRWFALFMVAVLCVSDFTSDRWIYWRRRLDDVKSKRRDIPDGMISIVLADGTPVYVPPTPELIEAVREIVAIVEGTDG